MQYSSSVRVVFLLADIANTQISPMKWGCSAESRGVPSPQDSIYECEIERGDTGLCR